MAPENPNRVERIACWWVGWVVRLAPWVVLAILAATAVAAVYVVRGLGINTDTEDMLSRDLPFRQNAIALDRAFPEISASIAVVLDSRNPDQLEDAAAALIRQFREHPDLLGEIFDPEGEPAFRRGAFLYLGTEELARLLDRLVAAQPFIGKLWSDPTLVGLFGTIELVLRESRGEDDTPAEAAAADLLTAIGRAIAAEAQGMPATLSWRRLFAGEADETGREFRAILLQPKLDYGSLQPGSDAIDKIREIAADLDLEDRFGVRLRLTGSVALEQEELQSVVDGLGLAGVLSFVLVAVLLIWGLRAPSHVLATIVTLLVGLVLTAAYATAAVGTLNLISVAFAVLFIGLSVDFGIHFSLRAREELARGAGRADALVAAAGDVGGALALSALAAAIAFFSFLPTDYRGLAELGVIAGGGMVIALIANLTLLPALLALRPATPRVHIAPPTSPLQSLNVRRLAKPVALVLVVLGAVSLFALPQIRFDFDPLNLRDPDTESVATLQDMMDEGGSGPYTIDILAPERETAATLSDRLSKLETVDQVVSIASFIPEDQDEKLAMIESAAFTLLPSLSTPPMRTSASEEERLTAFSSLRRAISRYLESQPRAPLAPAAKSVLSAMTSFATETRLSPDALAALERTLTATLPARLEEMTAALAPNSMTLETLPDSIKSRWLAADGRAKIEVFPEGDMRDRTRLRAFVESVRTVAPDAAGAPVTILEAGDTVVRSFIEAGMLSIVLITILVAVLLRSLREILYIYAPLVLAALLTVGVSVVVGLPFNFANIIVLPLLFGLGIAFGIHMVLRERNADEALGVAGTSTPRAVLFSALTTIGSFGSIALSSHPGTASMGILLTVAILLTLVCTLTVLPTMLDRWPIR